MQKILVKNGRVLDPCNGIDKILDVLIVDDKIEKVAENIQDKVDIIIDATDKWVTPGLIDLHAHLRQPGQEHKENIATGTRSAVKGGFTTICCMPNTNPVIDSDIVVSYINYKTEKEGVCNVLPVGAATKGQKGETLADIGKMHKEGICAISEDGKTILNARLMKAALKYAKMFDLTMLSHCEDPSLRGAGVMNLGERATLLGLKGIPNSSEDVIVARDILLAKEVDSKLHICHISTEGSVELVRNAKANGIKVTAEVTPHHFSLVDDDIKDYDANFKMSPPLRSRKDVDAIIQGLKDGTIDAIATDHAPHAKDEKECDFKTAANGIIGFETAVGVGIKYLVNADYLSPYEFISKFTKAPAEILGIDKGSLTSGKVADLTIIDPFKEYIVNSDEFESKARNTPYNGQKLVGKVEYTIISGEIIVKEGNLVEAYKYDNR